MARNDFDPDEDFYEDDEPAEEIIAAFERGEKFRTARPARLPRIWQLVAEGLAGKLSYDEIMRQLLARPEPARSPFWVSPYGGAGRERQK
jgi:hypothetical protein